MFRVLVCAIGVLSIVPVAAQRKSPRNDALTVVYEGLPRQPNAWYVKRKSPLAEASVCTGEAGGKPLGVSVILPSDTSRVGLYFRIEGGPDEGRLKLTLKRNFVEVHGARFTIPADSKSVWWVEPTVAWTFREGLYTFEFRLDDELLAALDFVVVSDPELDHEGLPEPEYVKKPPAPDEVPEQEADDVAVEIQVVTDEADAPESELTPEQQDLIADAWAEAAEMTDSVAEEVADDVVTGLREEPDEWVGYDAEGDAWSDAMYEADYGVEPDLTDDLKTSAREALDELKTDLIYRSVGDLDPALAGALSAANTSQLADIMVERAKERVKDELHEHVQKQAAKISGRSGLAGGALGVVAGHGVRAATDFISGLFGGGRRQPRDFFTCSDLTAERLAERMLETDGVQDALSACGDRVPVAAGAAGTSDTSKFGRGLLLVPLEADPGDEALAALLIVDDVSVQCAGTRIASDQGFPFRFRGDTLHALPIVMQVGAEGESLQILGAGGETLISTEIEAGVPEARAQFPLATVHQVVTTDAAGDTAMAVCSITPALDYADNIAPIFTFTVSRGGR